MVAVYTLTDTTKDQGVADTQTKQSKRSFGGRGTIIIESQRPDSSSQNNTSERTSQARSLNGSLVHVPPRPLHGDVSRIPLQRSIASSPMVALEGNLEQFWFADAGAVSSIVHEWPVVDVVWRGNPADVAARPLDGDVSRVPLQR